MTEFENDEDMLEYLSDTTINSLLGNSVYGMSSINSGEETDEISFSNSEEESDSDLEDNVESEVEDEQIDTNTIPDPDPESELLENYKTLIHSVTNNEITNNKELEKLNILSPDNIETLCYYENNSKENYDFKTYTLRFIFTKIILLKFSNSVNLKNITNLHITLDPVEIIIEGLTPEETMLMKNFFLLYLEVK